VGPVIGRLVSGGQTGVDRAALDAAIEAGIEYGGWCPKGGRAEDLEEPPGLLASYPGLAESPSRDYRERTEWNVRDSDATLILRPSFAPDSPGTAMTVEFATDHERPCLVVDPGKDGAADEVLEFLAGLEDGYTLNVAGPRESGAPGAYEVSLRLLREVLPGPG
jgi:hypothetical protein